jgi:hypothetical protein
MKTLFSALMLVVLQYWLGRLPIGIARLFKAWPEERVHCQTAPTLNVIESANASRFPQGLRCHRHDAWSMTRQAAFQFLTIDASLPCPVPGCAFHDPYSYGRYCVIDRDHRKVCAQPEAGNRLTWSASFMLSP